jgi:hypothetical protein
MTDDIEAAETTAEPKAAPVAAHESLIQRIEDAIAKFGSPAHALDWIKQEIAKFRAG